MSSVALRSHTPNPNARPLLCSSTVCRRPIALGLSVLPGQQIRRREVRGNGTGHTFGQVGPAQPVPTEKETVGEVDVT